MQLEQEEQHPTSGFKFDVNSLSLLDPEPDVDTSAWTNVRIHPGVAKYLVRAGLKQPTMVQQQALRKQQSQVLIAETGAGKTLAYLLPMLNSICTQIRLPEFQNERPLTGLVVAPTHELAVQALAMLTTLFPEIQRQLNIGAVLVGGMSVQKQQRILNGRPLIVFATPGRARQLLTAGQFATLERLVVDEADRMLEKGQFTDLVQMCSAICQENKGIKISLSSATLQLPEQLKENKLRTSRDTDAKLTNRFSHEKWSETEKKYLRILQNMGFNGLVIDLVNTAPAQVTNQSVQEIWHFVESEAEKMQALAYLVVSYSLPTMVFCETIQEAKFFSECFQLLGLDATCLHSQQVQKQRLRAVEKMQTGQNTVVFTTDVAARGIDLPDVRLVIQYKKPNSPATHVHRIGRCARHQQSKEKIGVAISLIAPDEVDDYKTIKAMCQMPTPPGLENVRFDVLDRVAHVMVAASDVVNAENEVRKLLQTLRGLKSNNMGLDEDDDDKPEEKDALQVAAEMMNDLQERRQNKLGRYYQMLNKRDIDRDDLELLLNQFKENAIQARRLLRAEVLRGVERYGAEKSTTKIMLFGEEVRKMSMPEAVNPLLRPTKPGGEKKKKVEKAEKPMNKVERAFQKKELEIVVCEPVDPLMGLARQQVEEEKRHENFKKTQVVQDKMKKKEDEQARRLKSDKGVGENKFRELTKQLAGEVDNQFLSIGPKDQRVRKIFGGRGQKKDKE